MQYKKHIPYIYGFFSTLIGICISYTCFLYLFQYLPLSLNIIISLQLALTVLSAFLIFLFLRKYIAPLWQKIAVSVKAITLTLSIGIGFLTTYQNPLQIPAIQITNTSSSSLSSYIGFFAISLFAGFIFFSVFSVLINQDPKNTKRSIFLILFLSVYIVIGMQIFSDFGISVDEPAQRETSLVNLKYILEKIYPSYAEYHFKDVEELHGFYNQYYGIAFQLPLVILEVLNSIAGQAIWLFRHLATFLFFSLGVVAFQQLVEIITADWKISLLGTFLFILTPRIFADSFYNIKDAIFLSAFTIAFFFGMRFLKNVNFKNAFLFGLAGAFASNVRIITGYLLLFICIAILCEQIQRKNFKNIIAPFILLIITFFAFLFLFWPGSWENPFKYLFESISQFLNYQTWNDKIMYMGSYIWGQDPPWHYLPVWMLITIPESYLLLFLVGMIETIYSLYKKNSGISPNERKDRLLIISIFIFPILTAIIFKSTLYNGWRHFYFTYTPFLLIAVLSLKSILRWLHEGKLKRIFSIGLIGFILFYQIYLLGWTIKNHPFENIYFNNTMVSLFGGREEFERDYWRLSAKKGWEYILSTDNSEHIEYLYEDGAWANTLILPDTDQKRLQYSLEITDSTDYYIYSYRRPAELKGKEVYSITVDGLKILSVYKLN